MRNAKANPLAQTRKWTHRPGGFAAEGLPVSAQLVARHFDECTLLAAAATLEDARGGVALPPAAA